MISKTAENVIEIRVDEIAQLSQLRSISISREGPRPEALQEDCAGKLPDPGVVANWRPLEIFLYDWWPIARQRDLYRRLSAAAVEKRPTIQPGD